eukprot:CAMPEP_0179075052 /NCGR_PEP_ID=MMETSP0796-20121207/33397_1 /TAXON_ID=73915 /ORGANISM="Pyrodinium bahamense, Strain pbaha01" /LENGTH=250 /DNA_ID=CAMNT_0020772283 /DNA_START=10 /DNA_END=763 /DNA_ORIENTATION=+
MARLSRSYLALVLSALSSAKFLPPTPRAAAESEPSHAWCSFSTSQAVRQRLEEEILKPAARAGIDEWPAGCPLDLSTDVFQDWQAYGKRMNKTTGRTCLADYCDMFDACGAGQHQQDACDHAVVARARRRCDSVIARCFPLSGNVTRKFHAQFSRQVCQILDCDVRRARARELQAAPVSSACLLAIVVPLSAAALSSWSSAWRTATISSMALLGQASLRLAWLVSASRQESWHGPSSASTGASAIDPATC